jgi:hypothetical protein
MTSAWKESPDRDDRAENQSVGPDENQLEMFEVAARDDADSPLPPIVGPAHGTTHHESGGQQRMDMTVTEASTLRFLDVGGGNADELCRLEDSIRWLMDESGVRHLPRAATLPPVRGLPPIEANEGADSLVLNPEYLFPPRTPQRQGGVARGVVKFLLASAVAAPTAYFIAGWLQQTDTATPSDVATVVGSLDERIAAAGPTPMRPPPERAPASDEISGAPRAEPAATRAILPIEARPVAAVEPNVVEVAATPEPSPSVSAAPTDPAAGGTIAAMTPPSAAPPKPALTAQEIAALVERGRVLFDAGDLAAARLFFRRAANAGDAAAALAMGSTYDPDVLSKRFIRGTGANAEEARVWYEKAREMGSPEGKGRLETLLAHR